MLNQQIQNYKIKSTLGEGGMGTVYLAEHITIQRKVAIKVLHAQLSKNESLRQRFQNEAVLMSKLQHPNIVGLIDFFEQESNLYLVMEFVEGIGLDDFIKSLSAPISIERGKNIILQILSGFAYAHTNGIVHRDVKPSNILITKNDEIKILDFGIAKLVNETQNKLTKTGTQIGTAYYMSPEQVKAEILDQRSDIYSLGITFYELLSGFCPYANSQSEYEVYRRIVEENLIPLTDSLGDDYLHLWSIIQKQTQKIRENRYSNCQEIIEAINSEHEGVISTIETNELLEIEKEIEELPAKSSRFKKGLMLTFITLFIVSIAVLTDTFINKDSTENEMDLSIEDQTIEIIKQYYEDADLDKIDAYKYFAPQVQQYITVKNLTPERINELNAKENDYTNRHSTVLNNTINFEYEDRGISYWSFWVDLSCYRMRRQQTQTCKVKIEMGFDKDLKIVSYKEIDIKELQFQ